MMAADAGIVLELHAGRPLHLILFRGVSNGAVLRDRVIAGEIDAALMDATMLTGSLHLLAAANKALLAESTKMITKSLYAELVYSLSATRNIDASLRTFGVSDGTSDVVAAFFGGGGVGLGGADERARAIAATVEGERVLLAGAGASPSGESAAVLAQLDAPDRTCPRRAPSERVRQLFKIGEREVPVGAPVSALQEAVVLRLATKEC